MEVYGSFFLKKMVYWLCYENEKQKSVLKCRNDDTEKRLLIWMVGVKYCPDGTRSQWSILIKFIFTQTKTKTFK